VEEGPDAQLEHVHLLQVLDDHLVLLLEAPAGHQEDHVELAQAEVLDVVDALEVVGGAAGQVVHADADVVAHGLELGFLVGSDQVGALDDVAFGHPVPLQMQELVDERALARPGLPAHADVEELGVLPGLDGLVGVVGPAVLLDVLAQFLVHLHQALLLGHLDFEGLLPFFRFLGLLAPLCVVPLLGFLQPAPVLFLHSLPFCFGFSRHLLAVFFGLPLEACFFFYSAAFSVFRSALCLCRLVVSVGEFSVFLLNLVCGFYDLRRTSGNT